MIASLIHFCHYPFYNEPFLPYRRLDFLVGSFRLNKSNFLLSEGALRFFSMNS